MQDIFSKLRETSLEAEKALCDLLDNTNTESMLIIIMVQLLSQPIDAQYGDKFGHHFAMIDVLAEFCMPRFGDNKDIVSLAQVNECYSLLEKVFHGRCLKSQQHESKLMQSLHLNSDVVRGSAYQEQIAKRIKEVQGYFSNFFGSNVGIEPAKAVDLLFQAVAYFEKSVNKHITEVREARTLGEKTYLDIKKKKHKSHEDFQFLSKHKNKTTAGIIYFYEILCELFPAYLPFDLQELGASTTEVEAIKKLIGIDRKTFNPANTIQRTPLYFFTSGKILLPNHLANCLDALWDALENEIKKDKIYERYQKRRATWLESQAVELLKNIFPSECVFQTLDYPDPDKSNAMTELDIAVKFGLFLILVEAKSNQFQFESTRGNFGKLVTGLKDNVEASYMQIKRAMIYIGSRNEAVFIERGTRRELRLNEKNIYSYFPISLSLQHLADLSLRLGEVKDELKLFQDGSYPFSICLTDLELILKTNIKPEIFLHYIKRRIELLSSLEQWDGDELDLFSAYLQMRLVRDNLPIKKGESFNLINFSGFSNDIYGSPSFHDIDFEKIKPNIPILVEDLLDRIRKDGTDLAKIIILLMLDMSDSFLLSLAATANNLKDVYIEQGIYRRQTFSEGDLSISLVASSHARKSDLSERTLMRVVIEKYRRKQFRGIGFGIYASEKYEKSLINIMHLVEAPWIYDEDLETLAENEPSFKLSSNFKAPKRNEQCFCGSGKKFKKCCLLKINCGL